MALKSEQARVLRRRVLGGLIRNLLLFSGAFALACLAIETFMVPSIANWVADSTSSWRTLNSSEQFQQILTDQGLLDDANLFDLWVNEAVESGYSNDAGTIAEVQGEVNEMEDALAEYASMMADSPENAEAAAAYAKERAEKLGADVAVASGTNAAAIGDTSAFIDDVAPLDAETDGAPDDKTLWAVPLLPYQTILTAEGIFTDEASAAHAMAALRVSASLQELGLSLPEAQTFMPPETTVDVATRILVSAAVLGYDQPTLNDLLQSAFRQSQEQAYSAWLDLTSAEEARALGVSDDHPVWQVQYGEDGVYRMRDVATYTFVKSFKLPLALLVFVAGWLVIILRALNRSLRYFDELGLLHPAYIDPESDYRYYREDQLPQICWITALRDMGFSLADVCRMTEIGQDAQKLAPYFETRRRELEADAAKTARQMLLLESARNRLGKEDIMQYNVSIKTIPERYAACVHTIIPRYSEEGSVWKTLCEKTDGMRLVPDEPCYCAVTFLDGEYKERDVEIEAWKTVKGSYPDTAHVKFRTLPAVTVASCTFRGPYEKIGEVYAAIAAWIADNGYECDGPMFNIYHVSPHETSNPEEFVTEACYPVRKQ